MKQNGNTIIIISKTGKLSGRAKYMAKLYKLMGKEIEVVSPVGINGKQVKYSCFDDYITEEKANERNNNTIDRRNTSCCTQC